MRPLMIYLIRHGESEGNVNPSLYQNIPDWKMNLTAHGIEQALNTASILKKEIGELLEVPVFREEPIRIYSSPFYRTRITAKIIQETLGVPRVLEDPRLREQGWGNFGVQSITDQIEAERHDYSPFLYKIHNGESGACVYDRLSTFIETLYRDFNKDIPVYIIVSHGLAIKAFLMRWFHWRVEDFDGYKTPKNCEILRMKLDLKTDKYILTTPLRLRSDVSSIEQSNLLWKLK